MEKRKKKRRKSKKRKRLNRRINRKTVIITAVALAMLVCTLNVFYMILGHYDGLGLRHRVPEHPYDMDALYEKGGRLYYEDENYTSVTGIDVSYYQLDIDWEKVKDDGIDFAMIRMGYRGHEKGDIHKDSKFKRNIRGAKKAGLDVGVYFFSQAVTPEEAVEEARYVIRHIKGRGVSFPVVFDMEPIPGAERIEHLTDREKTEITDAFCQVIERNGYIPMVYGNPQWLNHDLDLSYLTAYPTWLAHYTDVTDFPYDFKIWQYTDRGSVDGIEGNVDLNLYFKGIEKK